MLRAVIPALLCLFALVEPALAMEAQPTWGRPKETRPKEPPQAAPDAASGAALFVPAPNSWAADDPPRLRPSAESGAEAGTTYAWRTSDGLRYAWTLPAGYKEGEAYNLVIVCHPSGNDFHWGMATYATVRDDLPREKGFRPNDIVVCMDGTSASARAPERRSFSVAQQDAVRYRDVVLELSRTFPVKRIYHVGQGSGGQFAAFFSALFPALVDGVVDHAGGVDAERTRGGAAPIVLLHGAKDGVVPLVRSFEAKTVLDDAEHPLTRVRVLRGFNDFPSASGVSDCIDYCDGLRTDEPAEALAAATAMLTPKEPDEYDYRPTPWFGGAREVLARIVANDPDPEAVPAGFESVDDAVRARAQKLIDAVDAEGARHVGALRPLLGDAAGDATRLALDGGPWLGHLIALRDDFRGSKPVEDLCVAMGYDLLAQQHADAALSLIEAWGESEGAEADAFGAAVRAVPEAFLYEALPVDLPGKVRAWKAKAAELELAPDALEAAEAVENWERGWRAGLSAYEMMWHSWRLPE